MSRIPQGSSGLLCDLFASPVLFPRSAGACDTCCVLRKLQSLVNDSEDEKSKLSGIVKSRSDELASLKVHLCYACSADLFAYLNPCQ